MKKVAVFIGVMLLVLVVGFIGIARYGEHGVRRVDISEGEISFDWLVEPKMNSITYPWGDDDLGENLIAVQEKEGGSWDLINLSGDVLLKDFYQVEKIVLSGDNATKVLIIKDDEGKERFATMSGDILAEPLKSQIAKTSLPGFSEITTYVHSPDQIAKGLSPAKTYNLIDHEGNKVFKEDFSYYVWPLSNDRFIHKSGDKYGIIDRNLNVIVKHEYPEASMISVDRVAFRKDTPFPERIRNESEQDYMLRWAKSWRFGLFDSDGNSILPMEYGNIYLESEGLICVEKSIENSSQIAFFDRDGRIRISFAERYLSPMHFADSISYFSSSKIPSMLKMKLFNTPIMHPIVAAMSTTNVIDKRGKTLFTVNGSPWGYVHNGFFIIDKGIMGGYCLVSSSGRFYSLPRKLAGDRLPPLLVQDGVINVRSKEGEGFLRFNIK